MRTPLEEAEEKARVVAASACREIVAFALARRRAGHGRALAVALLPESLDGVFAPLAREHAGELAEPDDIHLTSYADREDFYELVADIDPAAAVALRRKVEENEASGAGWPFVTVLKDNMFVCCCVNKAECD
jgi:hypothetical protein